MNVHVREWKAGSAGKYNAFEMQPGKTAGQIALSTVRLYEHMGGATKTDFEWKFIFENGSLKREFQYRLFIFGVDPEWNMDVEC